MTKNDMELEYSNSRQLNVVSLLVRTLLRWKQLLIITIVCGLLGCVYGYIKENNTVKEATSKETAAETATESNAPDFYESMLASYDQLIAQRYNYLGKTKLKDMDPYQQPQATAVLYVKDNDSGAAILTERTDTTEASKNNTADNDNQMITVSEKSEAVLTALKSFTDNGIDYSGLSKSFELEESYISELVFSDVKNGVLVIRAIQDDENKADELLDHVLKAVNGKYQELVAEAGFADMELVILDRSTAVRTLKEQTAWMTTFTNELDGLIRARATFVSDYSSQKSVAEATVKSSISKKAVVKKGIQFALLGAFLGLVAILLELILGGKVLSAKELNESFETRNICVLNPKAKGIQKKILSIESENRSTLSDEVRLELAASLIAQLAGNGKTVAVIGDAPDEQIKSVAESLNANLTDNECLGLSSVNESVEERKKLANADYVILAAKPEKSRYSALEDLLVLSADYKKPVLGTIVC